MNQEELKRAAGEAAAERIESGQRIGLGTGSTARYFVAALSQRLREGTLEDVAGVPTSKQTEELARSLALPVTTLEVDPVLDLSVDGADEVDPDRNLIKGLGGALLREKIVAQASRHFVVIVDQGKLVPRLGSHCPLPIEVLPFGWRATAGQIQDLGATAVLREVNGQPFVSDQGNRIVDGHFGPIDDPPGLAQKLEAIPGVLGHGLFLDLVHEVLVATPGGVEVR